MALFSSVLQIENQTHKNNKTVPVVEKLLHLRHRMVVILLTMMYGPPPV